MGDVHDVDEEVRLSHLIECGFERLDQSRGEFADEADRVGEQEREVLDGDLADGGVERGEQLVFGEHLGVGKEVHECGFADVGVADERDADEFATVAPLRLHLFVDALEVRAQEGDALLDDALVHFDLRFTCASVGGGSTAQTVEVRPHTGEAREHVLKPCHFDLRLGIGRLRTLGEDVEDERRAVLDRNGECFLDVAELSRREFVVEDGELDGVVGLRVDELLYFGKFAFTDVGGAVG